MNNKTEVVIVAGSSGMIGSALIHKHAEKYHVVGFDQEWYRTRKKSCRSN